jgi:hypothetical protein
VGKWIDCLPNVHCGPDHTAEALYELASALRAEREKDYYELGGFVMRAAAQVRAWRTSLPQDQQSIRLPYVGGKALDDRCLIRYAIRGVLWADEPSQIMTVGDSLRTAEAALRILGKRHVKEAR